MPEWLSGSPAVHEALVSTGGLIPKQGPQISEHSRLAVWKMAGATIRSRVREVGFLNYQTLSGSVGRGIPFAALWPGPAYRRP